MSDCDPTVTVVYSSEPKQAVRRIVEKLQPFSRLRANDRVVLKPNLVVSRRSWLGANTRPEIVEGLVAALRECGVQSITVADGSGMGESATSAFRICGYEALAKRYGVRLLDIEKDRFVQKSTRTEGPFRQLPVSRTVAECDCLINVPVIKAHGQTRVTCSLKNLKGTISRQMKSRFHGGDLERAIAQLASALVPDFVLADGTYGDLSSELGGRPVNLGIVAAGYNALAIDCFAARTLGFSPREIGHIAHYARLHGLDLERFEPFLCQLNQPVSERVFPPETQEGFSSFPCSVSLGNACSTCYANLRFALERMRRARLLDGSQYFHLGQGASEEHTAGEGSSVEDRLIAVGDCAVRRLQAQAATSARIDISGCPPSAEQIVAAVRGSG